MPADNTVVTNPVLSSSVTLIESRSSVKIFGDLCWYNHSYPMITFTDESAGATNCHIDWGDGTITGCDSIHHFYLDSRHIYHKRGRGNDAECSDSSSAQILIRQVLTIPEYSLYIPNAFTQYGNGLNDRFRITYKGVENFILRILQPVLYLRSFPQMIRSPVGNGRFKGLLCPERKNML